MQPNFARKNMKKQKKIISVVPKNECLLVGADCAKVGEARLSVNLRERESALRVVGNCKKVGSIPAESELLALDEDGGKWRVITSQGGHIIYAGYVSEDGFTQVNQLLMSIGAVPRMAEVVGNFLVIASDVGTTIFQRTATGYNRIEMSAFIPEIMVGTTEKATQNVPVDEFTFQQAMTAWRAPLADADVRKFSSVIGKTLSDAIVSAEHDGRYCSPVVVKYGVRLWDDSYVWTSAPVVVGGSLATTTWASVEARTTSSYFTGLNAGTMGLETFRLGLTVFGGTDASCDSLVKSVDVWVGRAKFFELNQPVDYQCLTTQSGTRRYLFQFRPRTVNVGKVANDLACCGEWQLVASTSDLAALRAGVFKATNMLTSTQPLITARTTMAMRYAINQAVKLTAHQQATITRQVGTTIVPKQIVKYGGSLLSAGMVHRHENAWRLCNLFDEAVTQGSSTVAIDVTLSTEDGKKHIRDYATLPFVPTKVRPVVAFHDERAVEMQIVVQSGSVTRQCTRPLYRSEKCAIAYFAAIDFQPQSLETASSLVAQRNCFIDAHDSSVSLSAVANPLVQEMTISLNCGKILSVASSLKPLYSGGYGRYPLYLFAEEGVYALPRMASGAFGTPHLILRETIKQGIEAVEADEAIYFISNRATVHRLEGGNSSLAMQGVNVRQMAWNKREGELWLLLENGDVRVIERSGRSYRRTMQVQQLFANRSMPLAKTAEGDLLSLSHEESCEEMPIEWHSHPVEVNELVAEAPRTVVWNAFGEHINATLELCGENGRSCHGFLINRLSVNGYVNHPISVAVVSPAVRCVRLRIRGVAVSNFNLFSVKMI